MTDQFVFYEYQNRAHKEYQMAMNKNEAKGAKPKLVELYQELCEIESVLVFLCSMLNQAQPEGLDADEIPGLLSILESTLEGIKTTENVVEDLREITSGGDMEKEPLPGRN
jgi:hypothetical protein